MTSMFWSCESLKSLDLSTFNTSNVIEMQGMFAYCESLRTIIVSELWNTSSLNDSGEDMFESCHAIVGGCGTPFTTYKKDFQYARIDSEEVPGYLTSKDASGNIPSRLHTLGSRTIDLTNKTVVITDKDIATAILYTINGAISDKDIAIINEEEPIEGTAIDELDIDIDKNNTADIIVKTIMNPAGTYVEYMEITALDTRSVKESRTITMPEVMKDAFEEIGFQYYETLKIVFNIPKPVIPPKNRADKVDTEDNQPAKVQAYKKGDVLTKGKNSYKILSTEKGKRSVMFMGSTNSKSKAVVVPDTIKIDGKKFKVTEIKASAFKGMKKLKMVTLGKNVNKIGKKIFSGCKKLMYIEVKSSKLNAKNIAKKAFSGASSKSIMKVPAKVSGKYKKLFKDKGYAGKVE